MAVVSMKQLLESGVHFGHATRRWNPKMAPLLYLGSTPTRMLLVSHSMLMVLRMASARPSASSMSTVRFE